MPRLKAVHADTATGPSAQILSDVKQSMGMVPNIIATMANAPTVAQAYLGFSGAVAAGELPAKLREQIALTVAQANSCAYCLAAHSALGAKAGLSDADVVAARQGESSDAKTAVALSFARKIVEERGFVSDEDVSAVREAGYTDGEIAEIVANVALNIFTNYFNHVADPEIDFPVAPELAVK